jgi:hypothetical protein
VSFSADNCHNTLDGLAVTSPTAQESSTSMSGFNLEPNGYKPFVTLKLHIQPTVYLRVSYGSQIKQQQ